MLHCTYSLTKHRIKRLKTSDTITMSYNDSFTFDAIEKAIRDAILQLNATLTTTTAPATNDNNNTSNDAWSHFKTVATILSAGLAVLIVAVIFTYLTTVLMDKFLSSPSQSDDLDMGVLARKSGLWGLRQTERMAILQDIFIKQRRVVTRQNCNSDVDNEAMTAKSDDLNDPLKRADSSLTKESHDVEAAVQLQRVNVYTDTGCPKNSDDHDGGSSFCEQNKGDVPGLIPTEANDGDCLDYSYKESDTQAKNDSVNVKADNVSNNNDNNVEADSRGVDDNINTTSSVVYDDADHERTCCICLADYGHGAQIVHGLKCKHLFHFDCCMEWLQKHDHCPYCRREMFTSMAMLTSAQNVLTKKRFKELCGKTPVKVTTKQVNDNNINNNSSNNNNQQEQQNNRNVHEIDRNRQSLGVLTALEIDKAESDIEAGNSNR